MSLSQAAILAPIARHGVQVPSTPAALCCWLRGSDQGVLVQLTRQLEKTLAGASFMAVQQWLHDLDTFDAMATTAQDHTFGRRRSNNEPLDDAPPTAHIKRVEQESVEPPAFVLRRSMPWAQGKRAGLVFVAFGKLFDAFEALLNRMTGQDDGVTDALFHISKPITGAFFGCPPLRDGRLDLRVLGL